MKNLITILALAAGLTGCGNAAFDLSVPAHYDARLIVDAMGAALDFWDSQVPCFPAVAIHVEDDETFKNTWGRPKSPLAYHRPIDDSIHMNVDRMALSNPDKFRAIMLATLNHELAHALYGDRHVADSSCIMYDALDRNDPQDHFCDDTLELLAVSCDFFQSDDDVIRGDVE